MKPTAELMQSQRKTFQLETSTVQLEIQTFQLDTRYSIQSDTRHFLGINSH